MTRYLAQNIRNTFGIVSPPPETAALGTGDTGITTLLTLLIQLLFSIAAVVFIIIFMWGAFEMITSGGNKESLAHARARITWAIIGVVLLSLAFVIFRVLEHVTSFTFIQP